MKHPPSKEVFRPLRGCGETAVQHLKHPQTICVTLRPEPGVDGIRALRLALKCLLRTFRLRCIAITTSEEQDDAH